MEDIKFEGRRWGGGGGLLIKLRNNIGLGQRFLPLLEMCLGYRHLGGGGGGACRFPHLRLRFSMHTVLALFLPLPLPIGGSRTQTAQLLEANKCSDSTAGKKQQLYSRHIIGYIMRGRSLHNLHTRGKGMYCHRQRWL